MRKCESINNIIDWLKENGDPENDGLAFAFTAKDEPFMEFNAEWSFQRPGAAILFLGYYFEQNDDLCPNPQLTIHLRDGEIESVILTNSFGTLEATGDPYAVEFADLPPHDQRVRSPLDGPGRDAKAAGEFRPKTNLDLGNEHLRLDVQVRHALDV